MIFYENATTSMSSMDTSLNSSATCDLPKVRNLPERVREQPFI